ncbi:MAG: sigma-70 family RNA polymerase sigma factor [Planctomycetes bacterium]|nr:sigma-70 family RNA polymerase sigma factor [Planctomycetota bacterium]
MNLSDPSGGGDWISDAVARLERPLVLYVSRLLDGDEEAARDVVQEAFVRLCGQRPEQVDGRLAPWLYTVCRNRALDVRRRDGRMQRLTDETAHSLSSATPGPDDRALQGERREALADIMARLPARQEEALRLKFQHGMRYREIAEVMSVSVSTVFDIIHEALDVVRRALAKKGIDAAD